MTITATSAFAPSFAHTAGSDFALAPTDIIDLPSGNVATGTYRMCLAPAASDFLRALQAAMNAALLAEGSTVTVAITLSAAGIVTMTFSGDVALADFAVAVWRRLGLASGSIAPVGYRVITGTRPVWGLALLSSVKHGPWQPRQAGGTEQTAGGVVYAVAASLTSYQRKHAVTFQPTNPTHRAAQACEATALHPADEYLGALGSTATAREWAITDVLQASRNARCGIALGNWPTVRTSTVTRFYEGYVAGTSLLSPEFTAPDETWDAFSDWTLGVVLPTTAQSTTRA